MTHLDICTHAVDTVWDIDPAQVNAEKVILKPQSNPTVSIGAIVKSNLLVTLSGTADNAIITKVLAEIDTFTGAYVG